MNNFKLILAPMDGVLDGVMRELITSYNHYYYAESEFVRIVDRCISREQLFKKVPELALNNGFTKVGTPIYVQFLGQYKEPIAQSAKLAVEHGAQGIDLNFGCPAKKVNNSHGGAALLKEPELIHEISAYVRDAIPPEIPVTAKMRLGYENAEQYLLLAEKLYSSGINALCVHGRTKVDGYLPNTVRWDLIGNIRERSPIPIIANGDLFSRESAEKCAKITGCDQLMLARGALYIPNLARVINEDQDPLSYYELIELVERFISIGSNATYQINLFARLKQFLSYLKVYYTKLDQPFRNVCHCDTLDLALESLKKDLKDLDGKPDE